MNIESAVDFLNSEIEAENEFQAGPDATGSSMSPLLTEMRDRVAAGDKPSAEEFRTWVWGLYEATQSPMGYTDSDTVDGIVECLIEDVLDADEIEKFYETFYD